MGRKSMATLEEVIEALALQVGKSAFNMKGEDKFPNKLDALKALTTLKAVKSRDKEEPEGKGINDFAALWSTGRQQSGSGRSPEPEPSDDDGDGDYEPTETDGTDTGVDGDFDGLGRSADDADPAPKRHRGRLNGGQ